MKSLFPRWRMQYGKHYLLLDAVGLLGVALCVGYYLYGHHTHSKDDELANLWVNLSTDLVGAWISVRIISYVIDANRERRAHRLGTVRNSRYLRRTVTVLLHHPSPAELYSLERELIWSRRMVERRAKKFSTTELVDIDRFYEAIGELIALIKPAIEAGQQYDKSFEQLAKSLAGKIDRIETLRLIAEDNITDETPEE